MQECKNGYNEQGKRHGYWEWYHHFNDELLKKQYYARM